MSTVAWGVAAAFLLGLERACYAWAWRRPEGFRTFCRRLMPEVSPVAALERFFYGFKLIQAGVFVGWWWWFGGGTLWPERPTAVTLGVGVALIAVGQFLNAAVFHRLGRVGVFYGNRFGHTVPWCTGFPFSVLRHPQYVGTVLSIWGLFVIMRFPASDWLVVPLLETLYYVAGSRLES